MALRSAAARRIGALWWHAHGGHRRQLARGLAASARAQEAVDRVPFPSTIYPFPTSAGAPVVSPEAQLAETSKKLEQAVGKEPSYTARPEGYTVFHYDREYQLEIQDNPHGGRLPELSIAYETWGELNAAKDNAILLHTGLSASSHAASGQCNPSRGWWEDFIGPGKPLDTNQYFVVCCNVLGGCFGSTGPSSLDPSRGQRYATSFPLVTVSDMVRAQFLLLDSLGISVLHASVGASMGGMQSLAAASLFPERVGSVVSISAARRAHPTAIGLRYIQRRMIMGDPHWKSGEYYDGEYPYVGIKMAREVATISYRSGPEWEMRFDRRRSAEGEPQSFNPTYLIETYIDHQGTKSALRYDPNSLLYISKAMDMFELDDAALGKVQCPVLVLGVQSDVLFPIQQQRELTENLKALGNDKVTHYELNSIYGHDTFLIDVTSVGAAVKGHIEHASSSRR